MDIEPVTPNRSPMHSLDGNPVPEQDFVHPTGKGFWHWLHSNTIGCKDKAGNYHGLCKRARSSHLVTFFQGTHISLEDLDTAVATISFINAIVVTIPFGIMTSLDDQFWVYLEDVLDSCSSNSVVAKWKMSMEDVYNQYSVALVWVIYSTIGVLCGAVLYYLLRPKKSASEGIVRKWWIQGGRVGMILMLVFTVASIVSLLVLSAWLLSYYTVPGNYICNYYNASSYTVGYIVVSFCLVVGFLVML